MAKRSHRLHDVQNEVDLADLLFHELVHLQFYFESNADFNEAFATWFADKAVRRFLIARPELFTGSKDPLKVLAEDSAFQSRFSDLIFDRSQKAKAFYAQGKRRDEERKAFFDEFRADLVKLDANRKWPAYPDLNNAFLVSSSTYYRMVPKIEAYAAAKGFSETQMLAHV